MQRSVSEALDGKVEAVEYILNTILERADIKVKSTKAQVEYKSATKRSITLDIQAEDADGKLVDIEIQRSDKGAGVRRARYHSSMIDRTLLSKGAITLDIQAEDADGKLVDIEIQRSDKGAGVRRARYHSSMIDRTLLSKGEEFEDLVDTYVIFITENDKYGKGIPLYHVERKITELNDELFGDGAHILYVNGEYRNMEHPVGSLMHDFNCKDAKDMVNPLLAEEVRYLKETEGGQKQMCRLLEEMREEAAAEARAEGKAEGKVSDAIKMLVKGYSIEEIMEITDLPLEEVQELAQGLKQR